VSTPPYGPLAAPPAPKKALGKGKDEEAGHLHLSAVGLEAEFDVWVDGEKVRPEEVFGSPRAFLRGSPMHRKGTSYHLGNGGAIYFDTGVIELATPVIELGRGCVARAGRSLWESIVAVREDLDAWERRAGRHVRLVGYSTHYNTSYDVDPGERRNGRTVQRLARLLTYVLPAPVMLLACNPRSTGVGARPRGNRLEVTVDFTPSPALMIAAATAVVGIVRAVMEWPSYGLDMLRRMDLPVVEGFHPIPHTTRKGWLARDDCYPRSPFTTPIDEPVWEVRGGARPRMSLREIAASVVDFFRDDIREVSDPFTFRLLQRVVHGEAPSLLELPDRPDGYDDVGRLCFWDDLFPERVLSRSLYERVLIRAIGGHVLRLGGDVYVPTGMRGWTQVLFRRQRDGESVAISIDRLLRHLRDWERGGVCRPGRRG
jgi:hypothetical protein